MYEHVAATTNTHFPPLCVHGQLNAHVLIRIIIKNFDRSSWLKAPRTAATRTLTWITRIYSHTYINTVTTTLSEAPAQLLQNLESNFYFEGTRGRGNKPDYLEKTPDSLPANRYHILVYYRRKSNVPDGN